MRVLSLVVSIAFGAPALAQEPAAPPPDSELEELFVLGRTPENLRVEIERVENAVYARFNRLNSNDEFDIHCFEQNPTGSNIPLRTCAANFVTRTESSAADNLVTGGRSSATNNNRTERRLRLEEKSRQLTEEIQRVAREDPVLLRGLARLDELNQQQASAAEQRRQRR